MASSLYKVSAKSQSDVAYIKNIFSLDYVFPQQDTDENLKVEVSDLVSFGDIKDATAVEPQNVEVSGTVMGFRNTVRSFHPGKYKVTVIKLFDGDRHFADKDPLVIFHHEDVDPNLLARQVIRLGEDYEVFHRGLQNAINRYDWCSWTRHGYDEETKGNLEKATDALGSLMEEDFECDVASTVPIPDVLPPDLFRTLVFFTRTEDAKDLPDYILKNQVRRSSAIKQLFSVQDDNGETVSIGVHFTPFATSEMEYAKAFQDTESGSYFALIVHGYVLLHDGPWQNVLPMFTSEEKEEMGFTTIKKTGLKFPMSQFLLRKH